MYEFRFDEDARLMHVRVEGFWTLATLAAFSVKALATFTEVRLRSGHFATLIDARAFPIQSSAVAAGLALIGEKGAKITTGPVATIVARNLNKLQADRILATPQFRTFLDEDAALAWIDATWTGRPVRP